MPGERSYPEFGQCVHKVARHPANPDRLYLQNHGGVYRSDDGGDTWQDIAPGLPTEFGFAMVVHPHEPDTVFTFPITDAGARWPVDGKARVWRSRDAGGDLGAAGRRRPARTTTSWRSCGTRCAPTPTTPPGLYFGGRNGAVWASADAGGSWKEIVRDLPDVMMVRAAVV